MKILQKVCLLLGLAIGLSLFGQSNGQDTEDVLTRALKDELQRSLAELQIDAEPTPYFIAYTVNDTSFNIVQSILGATVDRSQRFNRNLAIALRVGSRELDNTNSIGANPSVSGAGSFPLTDSYDEIRRVVWMRTDAAYKEAVGLLAAKKTALQQHPRTDRANDFSEEDQFNYISDNQPITVDLDKLTEFANEMSAEMKGISELQKTSTVVNFVSNKRTYIDSDGNSHRLVSSLCTLRSYASAQATDGAMVHDYVSTSARSCSELYKRKDEIKQHLETLVASVLEFKEAEHVRSYTGPVLISSEASAGFFSQVFSMRAGARPRPVIESGINPVFENLRNPFMDKIGARVFPRFLSVTNDPTTSEFEGVPLLGSYIVDSEGMPARRTEVIKDGQLQALLTTRSPVKDFDKSSGSNRYRAAMPGNLFVSSSESVSVDELKQEFLTLIQDSGNDFGIVIKRFHDVDSTIVASALNGMGALTDSFSRGSIVLFPTLRAYKVNLDGTEVPIRTLTVDSFTDSQLRDIVAVSETRGAFNVAMPFSHATIFTAWYAASLGGLALFGNPVFVGVVSPDVLIEELTLQGGTTDHPRLPIVSRPTSE